ncbi:MAG: DUF3656 domain-containing protein [Selenomonadaceae bacterium]|nr:DUF3656 domain-containing protein [Selenomonadaceae bacterium]
MSKTIELLAPAGNFESLIAAVEAGADAVYLAGNHFGARASADNFDFDELKRAVEFAHLRNVAVHVTVNTIIADGEINILADYFKYLEKIHVDAILIQDLGAAALAKRVAPNLILHASTQMTVHSLEGVKALEQLGFSRVVLSRELSIDEIKYICASASAEIEVFMHGALCVCYSGQCLMSSMIGSRSGNRGQCAQPCRLPYELIDDNGSSVLKDKAGQYLLSPKDLNTIDLLPKLIESGVASLKIEGRMKRPEYVAIVVETYRRAIDRCLTNITSYCAENDEHRRLAQIFNRDFTTAYLEKLQGRKMISDKKPNNRGLLIGRVESVSDNKISIKLSDKINTGDQLEIWVKIGGRVTITVTDYILKDSIAEITTDKIKGVRVHDRVFKIFDAELTAHARRLFNNNAPVRRISIDAELTAKINQPVHLKLTDSDGNIVETKSKIAAVKAENRPLTQEVIYKQIGRLGTSVYELNNLVIDIDDNIMVPVSELNDLRRRTVDMLNELRLSKYTVTVKENKFYLPPVSSNKKIYHDDKLNLIAAIDSIDMLKCAVKAGANAVLFGGDSYHHETITPSIYQAAIQTAHAANKLIYIGTPRIVRDNEQTELETIINASNNADGIYVHNIATLNLVRRLTNLPIYTDYSLIAFNNLTIDFLFDFGVSGVTLSPELTMTQIKNIADNSKLPLECVIHGRSELMISSYCIMGSFIGGVGEHICRQPCKYNQYYLRDRKEAIFPIVTDQFCRMHILNSKTLSMIPYTADFIDMGINRLRIDGRAMTKAELSSTIKNYRKSINGQTPMEDEGITRGHYFRKI